MNVRDIRYIGSSALDELQRSVTERCNAWASDWCVEPAARFAVEDVRAVSLRDQEHAWFCVHEHVDFAFPGERQALVHALAGGATPILGAGEAESVCEEALCDLAARFGNEEEHLPATDRTPRSWWFDPRAGSILVALRIDDLVFQVILGPQAVERLRPHAAALPASTPLRRFDSLLDKWSVALSIALPLGDALLGDIGKLRVGDTITSSVPLDTAFDVRLISGRKIAGCRLGRTGDHAAIVLEHDPSEESV